MEYTQEHIFKNAYFNEHFSVAASKYSLSNNENGHMFRNLNCVQFLGKAPMEKVWLS